MPHSSLYLTVLLSLALTVGCSPKSNRSKVSGSVTLDGQPLAEGTIQFMPIDPTQGQSAGGIIKDGRYQLDSAPGDMRVIISSSKVVGERKAYDDPASPTVKQTQEQLPVRYSGPNSELQYKVEAGKENSKDFALTSEGEKPAASVFQ